MANDRNRVGYGNPPVDSRFKPGESGNPGGRPKKTPDFLEDAAAILTAPVTGQAKGKEITLPMMQAMFRRLCRKALKGDNATLRRVIDLMLTLEPAARQEAEEKAKEYGDAKRKLAEMAGFDTDEVDTTPREPDPEFEKLKKQADALAREERKRLVREARRRQNLR